MKRISVLISDKTYEKLIKAYQFRYEADKAGNPFERRVSAQTYASRILDGWAKEKK